MEALEAEGAKVTKSQVVLDRPIKALGVHEIKIALHPEVSVTVKVNVARSPEEADLQAQGIDVMAQMFERDAEPVAEELEPTAEAPETSNTEAEASTAEPEAEPAAEETPVEAPAGEAEGQ
jgi:large subunit ribosomal protein L9